MFLSPLLYSRCHPWFEKNGVLYLSLFSIIVLVLALVMMMSPHFTSVLFSLFFSVRPSLFLFPLLLLPVCLLPHLPLLYHCLIPIIILHIHSLSFASSCCCFCVFLCALESRTENPFQWKYLCGPHPQMFPRGLVTTKGTTISTTAAIPASNSPFEKKFYNSHPLNPDHHDNEKKPHS